MQDQGSLISTSEGSSSALTSAGDRINFALEPVGNFSPAQYNDFAGKTENSAIKSSDRSQQDLALLEDSGPLPEVPEAIKENFPAIFKIFGDTIQEFDNYGRRQWLRKVEQPNCKPGTYAFCCNLGAPNPNRVGATHPAQKRKTTPGEILKRRRKCTKCTFSDFPFIPEVFFSPGKSINLSDIRAYRGPGGAWLSLHLEHFLLFMQRQGKYIFLISRRKSPSRSNLGANIAYN